MLPADKDIIEQEVALGRNKALSQADKYWSRKPKTAATIDVPEKQITEAIQRGIQYAQIVAERNPDNGDYTFLAASSRYDMCWPTCTIYVGHMLLDPMGYHEFVAKHIEIFRKYQGQIKPNGPTYEKHPGHYSVPDGIVGFRWIADHGAVLYIVSKHALISNDKQFLDDWTDSIIKACDFIKYSLGRTNHCGVMGLMPAGLADDEGYDTFQGVWNDGWNYKGLVTAVRLLKRLNHPRADEFDALAKEYKEKFAKEFGKREKTMPTWTDKNGVEHKMTPRYFQPGNKTETTHAWYLDCGPLSLVWLEMLDADDPLMVSCLEFFRNGPNRAKWDVNNRSPFQPPCLIHEMSSCITYWSWSFYHSWQKNDRFRYLEGMYSMLAGSMSMQTYIGTDVRHGTSGIAWMAAALADLVKLAVIDDVIHEGELHLLRLIPQAWLRDDYLTRFENIATEYGQVTVKFKLQDKGETINLQFKPNFHTQPEKVILHVPPVKGLKYINLNGKKLEVKPGQAITISRNNIAGETKSEDDIVQIELNETKVILDAETGGILKLEHAETGVMLETDAPNASVVDLAYPVDQFEPLRLAARYSNDAKIEKADSQVTITWDRLGLSRDIDLPGQVAATVWIKAAPDGKSITLQCEIRNESEHPVRQVLFPDLMGFSQFAGEGKTLLRSAGFVVDPFELLKPPVDSAPFYALGKLGKGLNWVEYIYGAYHLPMILPWTELGSNQRGVSMYPRRWGWTRSMGNVMLNLPEKTGRLRLLHAYNEQVDPGTTWLSDEFWITPHKGGWVDGIESYREWILRNFKRTHPLPKRIRDGLGFRTVYMSQSMPGDPAGDVVWKFSDLPMLARDAIEHGLDEMVLWFWCQSFQLPITVYSPLGTIDEFAAAVEECRKIGVEVVPFITVANLAGATASRYGLKPDAGHSWTYHTEMLPGFNPYYAKGNWTALIDMSNEQWRQEVLASLQNLIDRGIVSFCWDVYLGNPKEPNVYTLTDEIRERALAKDPEASFGGESQNNMLLEAEKLDYTWSWVEYRDVRPYTSILPSPRLNANIDVSARNVKFSFVDNLYLNVMPSAPDNINGSDLIGNNADLALALKQCAKLRKQFLPYFTKGRLIGDCLMDQALVGAHISAYVLPDSLLLVVLSTASARTMLQLDLDLEPWLESASGRYKATIYNMNGAAASEIVLDKGDWSGKTPEVDPLEIVMYEFRAK